MEKGMHCSIYKEAWYHVVLFIKRLDIMLSEFCPDICVVWPTYTYDIVVWPTSTYDIVVWPTSTYDIVFRPTSTYDIVLGPASTYDIII
jgi:hypothetical protein